MTVLQKHDTDGLGGYPLRVAAAYAHLPTQTVRRWVQGYGYTHAGKRRRSQPISYLARPDDGDRLLDFEQLLTLLLVKAFKSRGLGLPTIKKAAAKAQDVYHVPNPFASNHFRSDGNKVFLDLDALGRERQLVDVLSDQREFRQIVEQSLFKDVVIIGDRASEWWPLGRDRHVVVAPDRQFGAPHIAGKGIRADVIADAVTAEGGDAKAEEEVAGWYGLTLDEVRDALQFEGPWLHQAS
jgi:uncharacterized protein (DUF433 family)